MNKINLTAYYATIKKKTGKTLQDFKELAIKKGYFDNGQLKASVKPAEVIAWLKTDFQLGHGHGLAIYHSLKDAGSTEGQS